MKFCTNNNIGAYTDMRLLCACSEQKEGRKDNDYSIYPLSN
jgi:hypothetical protein